MSDTRPTRRPLADRINPVVLKELRQAVRDGTSAMILLGFLGALLVVLVLRLVMLDTSGFDANFGRTTASWMMVIVVVVATIALPVQSAIRLHREVAGNELGLILITRIGYHRLFWGKVWVTMIKFALIGSTVLPFVTVTMLLRGVSLPAVTWAMLVNAVGCFGLTVGAMAVAAMPDGMVGRIAAALGGGAALLVGFFSMLGITMLVVNEGSIAAIVGSMAGLAVVAVVFFFFNLVTYSMAAQRRGRFNRFYYRPPTADEYRQYQRAVFEHRYLHARAATQPQPEQPEP